MSTRSFHDEIDAFIRSELEKSDSLKRILAQRFADTEARALVADDLIYLVADVLGTLREAILHIASEIDTIRN